MQKAVIGLGLFLLLSIHLALAWEQGHPASEIRTSTFGAGNYSFPNSVFILQRLGINNSNPSYSLDVSGISGFRNSIYLLKTGTSPAAYFYDGSKYLAIYTSLGKGYLTMTDSSDIILQTNNGNVGIGTTSPTVRLDVAGQVKISGGNPGVDKLLTSDSTGIASWGLRRRGVHIIASPSATTFSVFGMNNVYPIVTASAQASLANRMYLGYASPAVINSAAGLVGSTSTSYTQTTRNFAPVYRTIIRTDSVIDTRRIWVGLASNDIKDVVPSLTPGSSTLSFAALAYQAGVAGGNWLCCSGDGSTFSCSDTGVTVAASTEYEITVDLSSISSLRCSVRPLAGSTSTVTKTNNLPVASTSLSIHNALTTLNAAARNHFIAWGELIQN